MNNIGTRVFLMSVLCMMLTISSCQPENLISRSGKPIRFTAVSASPVTKTAYDATNPLNINWEKGDLISVYCAQASEPDLKCTDYEVSEVSATATQASIASVGGSGLIWGDDEVDHVFYAMYPNGAIGAGTMSGSIPATQKPKSLNATAASATSHFTAAPDMSLEYMVATNTIEAGEFDPEEALGTSDGVFLNFKPIVTAIEFTITNAFAADAEHPENEILKIKNIQLTSASHNIAGGFTADLTDLSADGTTYPECTSTSDGKTVTMDFTTIPNYTYADNTNKYIKVAKGQTLRFTFFLKPEYASGSPVDVDDLTFKIVKSDGSWVSTKLAYNDDDKTGITFPCHKKSYVTGILVPEGAQWYVKYDPTVQSWNTEAGIEINPMPEADGEPYVTSWDAGADEELILVDPYGGHEYVEIGGLKWATMNVGATTVAGSPSTCFGDYFAWGETEPHYSNISFTSTSTATINWKTTPKDYSVNGYDWLNYKHCNGSMYPPTKYNISPGFGNVDGKTVLDSEDDAATANWGPSWRTPTQKDFQKLYSACTNNDEQSAPPTLPESITEGGVYWSDNYNGVAGILFVDKKDINKRVFFPAASGVLGKSLSTYNYGHGLYMSSSYNTSDPRFAYLMNFCNKYVSVTKGHGDRCDGYTVRPVSDK